MAQSLYWSTVRQCTLTIFAVRWRTIFCNDIYIWCSDHLNNYIHYMYHIVEKYHTYQIRQIRVPKGTFSRSMSFSLGHIFCTKFQVFFSSGSMQRPIHPCPTPIWKYIWVSKNSNCLSIEQTVLFDWTSWYT